MTVASVASPPPLGLTLTARHVTYDGITLFRDLTLDLPAGHWTCLLGISGVGKSSLLRLLADLAPTGSDYHVQTSDNRPLTGRIAYMAQQDFLLPWLSVLDNITLGARLRRQPADTARADSLLEQVGLADLRGADGRAVFRPRPGHPPANAGSGRNPAGPANRFAGHP